MKTFLLIAVIWITSICHVSAGTPHSRVQAPVWKDPGVDVGIVNTPTALFTEPDAGSAKISALNPQDWTILVSRKETTGWLHVIGLSSGRQGWAKSNRLTVRYTLHPNKGVDLPSEQTGTDAPPVLNVKNDMDKTLYLHIDGEPEIHIDPHAQLRVSVNPGVTTFNASAPNDLPAFGNRIFVAGNSYHWRFWDRGHERGQGKHVLSPALKAEAEQLQRDISTESANLKIEKQLILAEWDTMCAESDRLNAEEKDLEAERPTRAAKDPEASVDFDKRVNAHNDQRHAYHAKYIEHVDRIRAYNTRSDALATKEHRLYEIAHTVNGY
ncbi:hypothetical protein CCAX7_34460 [Capsulimonas corticalis]|uniref:Uncharacterized protein n=1 Tax=Capsulimonas corticalis TaxID=2219043 RepID=A0A402CYE5_9BACT|nr:hypothetical protein CCAX7_34460 [Capsulimonas corticalis]